MTHDANSPQPSARSAHASSARSAWEVFRVSLMLGLTSFGGPTAHLGYFREAYVARRRWVDERTYADLVALCQFLPGPASSQVGMGIGLMRAGYAGALAAWLGFTLPSALLLALLAIALPSADYAAAGWLHGLKLAAVAVVAHAALGMGRSLAPDKPRAAIAVAAALALLLAPTAGTQLAVIAAAGLAGWALLRRPPQAAGADRPPGAGQASPDAPAALPVSRRAGLALLALFALLLVALPLVRGALPAAETGTSPSALALADSFYRAGSLVFGGGHVVLPLLQQEVVPTGWVEESRFLAGYGAAQAVPGPLFTFAAYLGAAAGGWTGAAVALAAIFVPAFLLVAGTLPFWHVLRSRPGAQGALAGVNAAVVGILLAALYDPVWTDAVREPADFALALLLYAGLAIFRLPPWLIVLAAAGGGSLLPLLP